MVELKTKPQEDDVAAYVAEKVDPAKQADSLALIALMRDVSGEEPVLWGTMIGFGQYHYRYDSGHEGDSFRIGFAPRKAEFSLYLMGCSLHGQEAGRDALLARMGKHRMGKACIYVKRLGDIDLDVLRKLCAVSIAAMAEVYPAK